MQANRIFGATLALVKAGLTGLSGAATTFTTGVAITYAILGKAFAKAAVTGGATPTVDGVTGKAITLTAGFGTVVVWALDAAGTVLCIQGSVEPIDQSGNFVNSLPGFPILGDLAPFAYSIHKAGHAQSAAPLVGTFTFGTSNWNTTGMTHTVQDVITLPTRPQAA